MLTVLYEDNHILAVNKSARTLTMGDKTGDVSLVDEVRDYLKVRFAKPGNVFVGVVHRLDRPVSGVVIFARTSKGASRLSEQFREGTVEKTYWAWVEGTCHNDRDEWCHWLLKNESANTVRAVAANTPGAKESRLAVVVLKRQSNRTLFEVTPITGRSHQIRVQLAAQGFPIVGDTKYGMIDLSKDNSQSPSQRPIQELKKNKAGSGGQLPSGTIALHACSLSVTHPTRGERIKINAPLPAEWQRLG